MMQWASKHLEILSQALRHTSSLISAFKEMSTYRIELCLSIHCRAIVLLSHPLSAAQMMLKTTLGRMIKEIFRSLKNVDLFDEKLCHHTISTCQMKQYSFELCQPNPHWSRIFAVQILFDKVNKKEVYLRHLAEIQLGMEAEKERASSGMFTHNRLGLTPVSPHMEAHPKS